MIYQFKMDDFMKSMPHENAQYMSVLQQTQGLFRPHCLVLRCLHLASIQ